MACDEQRVFATNILVNSLGNLTILGDSKNSSVSNSSWNEKRERYRTGSFNEIEISENENEGKTVLKLKVAKDDMGRIIGKEGRIIRSIREIIYAYAAKEGKKVSVDVEEQKENA